MAAAFPAAITFAGDFLRNVFRATHNAPHAIR
jgi:hypothetical protein